MTTKDYRQNYRLRILEPYTIAREKFTPTYIVRKGDRVCYIASDETPLALANLILEKAAEMRFKLEDARDGDEAAKNLRDYFMRRFAENKALLPQVEVLP